MRTYLLLFIIVLGLTGCVSKSDPAITIELHRIMRPVDDRTGMHNIFFEANLADNVAHPEEWQEVEAAPVTGGDGYRTVYAVRHKDAMGEWVYLVDVNADQSVKDETPLVFSEYDGMDYADIEAQLIPELGGGSERVAWRILLAENYTYALIREYRSGDMEINGQHYAIEVQASSSRYPVISDSTAPYLFIDANRNETFARTLNVSDEGVLQTPEKFDPDKPFLLDGKAMQVTALTSGHMTVELYKGGDVAAAPGFIAPDISSTDLDGGAHTLHENRGKLVLVEFWSIYCPFCERARPSVNELRTRYSEDELQLFIVAMEDSTAAIEDYIKDHPKAGKLLLRDDVAWKTYNPHQATPTYVLIDQDGRIDMMAPGSTTVSVFEQRINEMLAADT